MRGLLVVAVAVGALAGSYGAARAERRLTVDSCHEVATQLARAIGGDAKVVAMASRRCDKDRWKPDSRSCFVAARSADSAALCLDTLSRVQRKAFDGDADRLRNARLTRWLFRRTFVPASPTATTAWAAHRPALLSAAPVVTLAAFDGPALGSPSKARRLQAQGMAAYRAGRYDVAARKFAEAMQMAMTPELVYHAAQAYRLDGERAEALELYELYLEIAPRGPASNACRRQVERLRYAP